MTKIISATFILGGIFTGIYFHKTLDNYVYQTLSTFLNHYTEGNGNILTEQELARYDGVTKPELYIAFMGLIFDVTTSPKHYGKGAPYNYFVGRDGTRAFITGDFQNVSENKDHILDLTCDELLALMKWKVTINEKYKLVGYLIGRYYDKYGKEMKYNKQSANKVDTCLAQKEIAKEDARKMPPCNISWSADKGTRVWCTKSSGGIVRSWAGVPRQHYAPGAVKPHCVCINESSEPIVGMFQEYKNCPTTSTSCNIEEN